MNDPEERDALLAEQIAYYRAIAAEYEDHSIPGPGADEVLLALDAFGPTGHVLELACGPGAWTKHLLRHATTVTAVDASPEMLARARARVGGERVSFIHANLFSWAPDCRYDAVFFGFWISHVPLERFAAFWSMIADALKPGGRVFFVDDSHRAPEELIHGEGSSTVQRRLNDGTPFLAVKVPHRAQVLQDRLERLGWSIEVTQTAGPFYWGAGGLAAGPSGSGEPGP